MYKTLLVVLFSIILTPAFGQKGTDTFKLYFDLNVSGLNPKMENKIDLLIYNDKIINGSSVMIVGYADFLGNEKHNRELSMKRAASVKDYLVKNGVNAEDVKFCEGKGQVDRSGIAGRDGVPTDRRVDIVVDNRVKKTHPEQPLSGKKDTARKPATANINEIKHLEKGAVLLLKDVYFPPDRHTIMPQSNATLEQLYQVLEANPNIAISIEGHVCCIQNSFDALDIETNEASLSVNRAREIYNYLVNKGIDPQRLTYRGFGRSRPVVPVEMNSTDREKNRRVEVRIVSNR